MAIRETAQTIALTSIADIGVFFAVLMVGFAYVWKRGDLDWVKAVNKDEGGIVERAPPKDPTLLPVLRVPSYLPSTSPTPSRLVVTKT